jgi:hypothetical protein
VQRSASRAACSSCIFLAFPDAGRAAVGVLAPVSPSPRGIQAPASQGRPITPDEAVALARAQLPEASVIGVAMLAGPRGVYRIAPGTVLRKIDGTTQTGGDAFLAYQRPLHEGDALGLAGRVVICAVGAPSRAVRDGNDDVAALARQAPGAASVNRQNPRKTNGHHAASTPHAATAIGASTLARRAIARASSHR